MEHHTHHEPKNHATPGHESKSFFEKYQTFISIIIAGLLIAGGIVLSKTLPQGTPGQGAGQPESQTEAQVRAELIKTAKSLSLNSKALGVCLDNKIKESVVADAMELANKSGVQGTPTFVIIKRTYGAGDNILSEKQIPVVGARDKATFIAATERGIAPDGQSPLTGEKIVLTETDHYRGPARAEVIIVEYSDIDCPFCKRAKPTIEEILTENPEYAYVYRHSPLVQLHPLAAYKAQATECILESDGPEGFWKFLNEIAQ